MRFFVTGASGFIGSAVVPELLQAGHQVVGLARSEQSAASIRAMGADVVRGELTDLDTLRATAAASDGVIHLAFIHDFARFAESAAIDQRAIVALGEALEGTNRPLLVASGLLGLTIGRAVTEHDLSPEDPNTFAAPRLAGVQSALSFVPRGVRTVIVRFAPTVHGEGDHGFIPFLIERARERGVSPYIGDGSNRWAAVNRRDAARVVRLAAESGIAGTAVHAVGEEGIATRSIAEAIGFGLNVPVVALPHDQTAEHFSWMSAFFGADCSATNETTRRTLHWEPSNPGLIDDLALGHYFAPRTETLGVR